MHEIFSSLWVVILTSTTLTMVNIVGAYIVRLILCIPTVAHSVYITHEISVHHCLLESSTTHGVRIILLLVVGKVSNVQAIENADSMSFKVTS